MEFHAKLSKLIAESRLDQNEIGRQLGIKSGRMSNLATGKGRPTGPQLLAFARFFGVPMEWLADDSMEEIPRGPAIDPAVFALLRIMSSREALRRLGRIDDAEAAGPAEDREDHDLTVRPAAAVDTRPGHLRSRKESG